VSSDVVRIPVAPALTAFAYAAYVKLPSTDVDLPLLGAAWALRFTDEPLRSALERYFDRGAVQTRIAARDDVRAPPIELLRAMRLGREEERRFEDATHVVLVRAPFVFHDPPLHVLGSLAVANGIAATFDGVVFDPEMPRVLPLGVQTRPFASDGRVTIVDHVMCSMSASPSGDGTIWMTTSGLRRFGLPNLEMRFVPSNLVEVLPIVNAVAHRLLGEGFAQAAASGSGLPEIFVPADLAITHDDLVGAYGRGHGSSGGTTVRISYSHRRREGMEPFVEIGPPTSFMGERSDWYHAMLGEFLARSS
jgi:hypothetical protein